MRIELPSPSWADTVQRADDDAHTLTVAAQQENEWLPGDPVADPMLTVRMQIALADHVLLTITF